MDEQAGSDNSRYITVSGALLGFVLSRLGWSDGELATAVSKALEIAGGTDPKRVADWRKGGRVERPTYAALMTALQVAIDAYRQKHKLRESDFPTPLTLDSKILALADKGKLFNRVETALRLSARLFSPDEDEEQESGPLNDLRKAAFLSEYCGLKGFIQRSQSLVGERISASDVWQRISTAVLESQRAQPFYAAVWTGEYAWNIVEAVAQQTARRRGKPPISKIVFRTMSKAVHDSLVAAGVIDDTLGRLKVHVDKVEKMSLSRAGPVKVSVEDWPRLPPLFAWMYGDCLAYSPCDVADDGRLKSSARVDCYYLTALSHPEAFRSIATLVRTGSSLAPGLRRKKGGVW